EVSAVPQDRDLPLEVLLGQARPGGAPLLAGARVETEGDLVLAGLLTEAVRHGVLEDLLPVEAIAALGLPVEQRNGAEDVLGALPAGDQRLGLVVETAGDLPVGAAERRQLLDQFLGAPLALLERLPDRLLHRIAIAGHGVDGLDVALGDGLDLENGTDGQLRRRAEVAGLTRILPGHRE